MPTYRHLNAALLTAALICGPAVAQTPPAAPPPVITNPDWLRKPSALDLSEYFPPAAIRAGRGGRATISCTVAVTGLLRNCIVVNETPRGMGLGIAAVGLSSKFQMRPPTLNGVPVEGQISVPIAFTCRGCSTEPPVGSHITPKNTPERNNKIYLSGVWTQAPTFEQWKASYPKAAAATGASGGVSFECGIRKDGALSSCAIKNETPGRLGFAAAGRTLIPYFRAHPAMTEVNPPARVIVTIAYPRAQLDKAKASASPSFSRALATTDMAEAFPNAARDEKIPFGRASVQCALADDGAPTGCTVRSETPAGKGFGGAALVVAPKLRFNMWTAAGEPVNRGIVIPLAFGEPPRGEEELSTLVSRAERYIEAAKLTEARAELAELQRRFAASPETKRVAGMIDTATRAAATP